MKKAILIIFFCALFFVTGYVLYVSVIDPIIGKDSYSKDSGDNSRVETTAAPADENRAQKDTVTLSFMGDVLLDGHVATLVNQKGADFILSDVKPVLDESDISMVNLECPVSEKGAKARDKQYTFRAKPESLNVLTSGGIDIITLANNHILDFGREALLDTIQYLGEKGIHSVGAGENTDEASKPFYIEKNGLKVAFIASSRVIPNTTWAASKNSPGVATTYNPERLLKEIESAKSQADIVVVYIHWGEELKEQPAKYQKNLAKAYIDRGADIVLGSHPHVLQGLEYYKGKVIAYSLGNFIFTNYKKDTMILKIESDKEGIQKVQVIPSRIESFRPVLLKDKNQVIQSIRKIESLSFNVKIDETGDVKPR
ncbi:MAG: CapA family protein [Clostridia bacterium]|nr:CapA family protein [Clostridia bacterium]